MTRIKYIEKKFQPEKMAVIAQADEIIREYSAQGFSLTLRQLYYQFVARDLIPNTERSYKRLGTIISDARMTGMIDWESIEDRTRNVRQVATWDSPAAGIRALTQQYRIDLWENQPTQVEVWIEKEALAGVIAGVCDEWRVPYFSCRGYVSQSEQWRAGQRIARRAEQGQDTLILHLGDHDPSGMDMTRDNDTRLDIFSWSSQLAGDGRPRPEIRRIALNWDQIERYQPPPNPAKLSDSRAAGYVREYGYESWELDALEPKVIRALIEAEVQSELDLARWEDKQVEEQEQINQLEDIAAGLGE